MNRYEAAGVFACLSDPDRLKIVKMAYRHGQITLEEVCEKLGIGEAQALDQIVCLQAGGLIGPTPNGYAANRILLEEAMGFLSHSCGAGCGCHHHESSPKTHQEQD